MPAMHSATLPHSTVVAQSGRISGRDQELLIEARAGSNAAFKEIHTLYSDRLYKRILSITRNHEDAEDALQDAFMRAYLALDSFEFRSHLFTWLTKISINSALMIIRRRRNHAVVSITPSSDGGAEVHEFDIRDTAPNPEEICDRKQRFERASSAIERLDSKSRTAIELRITQECSMKEIADTWNIPVTTVKARLHRARKKLAREVASRSEEPVSQMCKGF